MSTNVIPFTGGAMPAHLQNANVPDMHAAAQAGVQDSMAVISFKGKVWRFKYRGEETIHRDERGAADQMLDVVIVGVADAVSKIYYKDKYTEGDNAAPDCWSTNGIVPDASASNKQSETCSGCPMAEWGSAMTEDGRKKKACQDSKRLAVVPFADVENARFGGPMMLRLSPTVLAAFKQYSKQLAQHGAQFTHVVTRLAFDEQAAYPKVTFQPVGWVDAAVFPRVEEWTKSDEVARIINQEERHTAPALPAPAAKSVLAGGPPAHLKIAAPAAPVAVAAAAVAAVAAAPTVVEQKQIEAIAASLTEPVVATSPEMDEIARLEARLAAAKAAQAQSVNPPAPAAAPAPVAEGPVLEGEVLAPQPVVKEAPSDMVSAINDLLANIGKV